MPVRSWRKVGRTAHTRSSFKSLKTIDNNLHKLQLPASMTSDSDWENLRKETLKGDLMSVKLINGRDSVKPRIVQLDRSKRFSL